MALKSSKTKIGRVWGDDNPEKLGSHGSMDHSQTLTSKVVADIAKTFSPGTFIEQLLGTPQNSIEAPVETPSEKQRASHESFTIFSLSAESKRGSRGEMKVEQETQAILQELKQQAKMLSKSEKTFTESIAKINVDQMPEKKGIYYLIFFEWLIGVLKHLRMKMDEGATWLEAFNARGKKKQGYWQKFKKQGTTFGLSNERTLATQTG